MSVKDFPPRPQGAPPDSVPHQNWLDTLGDRQNIDAMQELTSVASGDEIAVFDVSETGNVKTKKATVSNIAAGAGAVIGPASSTDNAAVRFDSTTGKLVQNSAFIIDDSGYVSSFGGQIKFPATQAASADANTLDDYEEGTFTPTVSPGSGSLTAYTSTGNYTKIGNDISIACSFTITTVGTAGGNATLNGLPFTSKDIGHLYIGSAFEQVATGDSYVIYVPNNSSSAVVEALTGGAIAWVNTYKYACSISHFV